MSTSAVDPHLAPDVIAGAPEDGLALAVSGGSDSLALMLLAHQAGLNFRVVSVDHGLRPAAQNEIAHVRTITKTMGYRHSVIPANIGTGNLMAAARTGRYRALTDWAGAQGITQIWLGHTADDAAEGFWLRVYRGSGVRGLSPMAMRFFGRDDESLGFVRPLLDFRRQELRDFLTRRGIAWCDDPSNEDDRFARARLRKILHQLEAGGFAHQHLQTTMAHLGRVEAMMARMLDEFARAHVAIAPLNIETRISRAAFLALDPELALRLLAEISQYYGARSYQPRLRALTNLRDSIAAPNGRAVLSGTEWHWGRRILRAYPEFAGLPPSATGAWYLYHQPAEVAPIVIAPMGEGRHQHGQWREWGISSRAARALPADARGSGALVDGLITKAHPFQPAVCAGNDKI